MEQSKQVSFRLKCWLCVVAWSAAVIAMAIVEEGRLSWDGVLVPPVLNPAGLAVFWLLARGICDPKVSLSFGAFAGWIYYAALTTWSLRAKRRVVFTWVFIVLCISLLLNIAGCAAMKNAKFMN